MHSGGVSKTAAVRGAAAHAEREYCSILIVNIITHHSPKSNLYRHKYAIKERVNSRQFSLRRSCRADISDKK